MTPHEEFNLAAPLAKELGYYRGQYPNYFGFVVAYVNGRKFITYDLRMQQWKLCVKDYTMKHKVALSDNLEGMLLMES